MSREVFYIFKMNSNQKERFQTIDDILPYFIDTIDYYLRENYVAF